MEVKTDPKKSTHFAPEVVGLRKMSPRVTGSMIRIREEAYSDGLLPAKHKVLTALAISVIIKCEPCIEMYVSKARELGATKEETVEILNVAIAMGGCPGEAWSHKALSIYQRVVDEGTHEGRAPVESNSDESGDSCCP